MSNIDLSLLITKSVKDDLANTALRETVNAERDRRIYGGFMFGGVLYQSDDRSLAVIDQTAQQAFIAITNGAKEADLRWADPNIDFFWVAADNSTHPMDAQTVVALNRAAVAWRSNLILKGTQIKALSPIPSDYTADSYWAFTWEF